MKVIGGEERLKELGQDQDDVNREISIQWFMKNLGLSRDQAEGFVRTLENLEHSFVATPTNGKVSP